MAENGSQHHSAPVWGIFLLFLGIVFLLQTTGVLSWALWQTLGNLWPVLIIVVGLAILLRHFNVWLVSLLIAVIFGATLVLAISQYNTSPIGAMSVVYSQLVSSSQRATVNLDLNASDVTVESLPADSTNLVEVSSTMTNVTEALDANLNRNGNNALLSITIKPSGPTLSNIRWIVKLAQKLPLDVTLKANASNAKLTISDITLSGLQLQGNAGNVTATLPALPPTVQVKTSVKANAANIELTVPPGTHASVQTQSTLSSVDVASRFVNGSDSPVSSSGNGSSYMITIDANVSHVQVR